MMSYNTEKGYYEVTAYVYNIRSGNAVAVVIGNENKVSDWIDHEFNYLYDRDKYGTAYDIKAINKTAKIIDLGN
jgi:hypothetical protein